MIYKGCGVEYKENGRESYLYLQEVNDNDVALLEYLGYRPLDCNRGRLVDEPETETWAKYETEEQKVFYLSHGLFFCTVYARSEKEAFEKLIQERGELVTEVGLPLDMSQWNIEIFTQDLYNGVLCFY